MDYGAKPKLTDWLIDTPSCFALAICYAILPLYILSYLLPRFYERYSDTLIVIIPSVISALLVFLKIRENRYRHSWTLTKTSLIRGRPQNLEIKLSSISEIRTGLWYPRLFSKQLTGTTRVPDIQMLYDTALIIRTEDGFTLLLQLIKLDGGLELMNKLVELKRHCVKNQLFYSEKEVKFLKLKNANRVLEN